MEQSKETAYRFFHSLAFNVRVIPEANEKRADLALDDGCNEYLVEVKEKESEDLFTECMRLEDKDTDILIRKDPHSRSNRIDGILKHGAKQLNETPATDSTFRIIWLQSIGMNADMTIRRALQSFYGIATLLPKWPHKGEGINCVYFDYSACHSMQHVDGLMLVENRDLLLCLNEFSHNYFEFRKSLLVKCLGEAICDPKDFDGKEGTIVLRSDISRKNEQHVLNELERQVGVRYSKIVINRYSFGARRH